MKKYHETFCQMCEQKFKRSQRKKMVGCDECTRLYHMECISIKDTNLYWKCPKCKSHKIYVPIIIFFAG